MFFPERLSKEFLDGARRTMGSYFFANQYQNEIIPEEEKKFKQEWLIYYDTLPQLPLNAFAFIDPAIGQKDHNDYTGITIIKVDPNGKWYVEQARRERLTPTQIVEKCFEIHSMYKTAAIGIEIVAYQEALLYILDEKMKQRRQILPVKGIRRGVQSKETRVLGLVPRFEWGGISIRRGMFDFEDEYNTFPRGTHDDILDSLASCEEIVFYPQLKGDTNEKPNSPNDPRYEQWYIKELTNQAAGRRAFEQNDDFSREFE